MPKLRVGHSVNSKLNGEWGKHVRGYMKRLTSRLRRIQDRKIIREALSEMTGLFYLKQKSRIMGGPGTYSTPEVPKPAEVEPSEETKEVVTDAPSESTE